MNTTTANTAISANPNVAQLVVHHRPGVEEDHLDVEDDEDHRDQVEANREAGGGLVAGGDARLVGPFLGSGRPLRAQASRHHHRATGEQRHQDQQQQDRQVLLHALMLATRRRTASWPGRQDRTPGLGRPDRPVTPGRPVRARIARFAPDLPPGQPSPNRDPHPPTWARSCPHLAASQPPTANRVPQRAPTGRIGPPPQRLTTRANNRPRRRHSHAAPLAGGAASLTAA